MQNVNDCTAEKRENLVFEVPNEQEWNKFSLFKYILIVIWREYSHDCAAISSRPIQFLIVQLTVPEKRAC